MNIYIVSAGFLSSIASVSSAATFTSVAASFTFSPSSCAGALVAASFPFSPSSSGAGARVEASSSFSTPSLFSLLPFFELDFRSRFFGRSASGLSVAFVFSLILAERLGVSPEDETDRPGMRWDADLLGNGRDK
ncbi:hypothetical protein DsansV1_C03g0031541 [Dioscorea sansibarensis]